MEFLKKFFNDDSTIVGLCGFKTIKTEDNKFSTPKDFLLNPFQTEKVFETRFEKNIFLSV